MRKFQKEQLSKHMGLLREACDVLTEQQPGSGKINLCADMQEYILAILKFLDSIDEENTELTDRLSELYKELLKVSQDEVSADQLAEQLGETAAYIENDMKISKMEVVFFCHKASMGGRLERIYQDIRKYDGWDAYIVPIPYYDKDETGALGTMHYEAAGDYPTGIELADWKTYNVEQRCPDVVFVTDVYGELGSTATVHPDFYASRLREFTDLLVCVPCTAHDEEFDPDAGKLPGVCLADKVVVDSEDVRQQYISSILSHDQETSRETLEKKVVTFDSLEIGETLESR